MNTKDRDFILQKKDIEKVVNKKVDRSKSKRKNIKIKESELSLFWKTFKELHPVIIKSFSEIGNKEIDIFKFKENLTENISYFDYIVKNIVKGFGFSSQYEISESQRRNLGLQVSQIIKNSKTSIKEENLASAIKSINDYAKNNPVFKDIEENHKDIFVSEDVMVNLKINCLKESVKLSETLDFIGCTIKKKKKILKLQQDIAVRMSKDICFNQTPEATLWDRETAFIALIEPCMESARQAWINVFCYQVPADPVVSKNTGYLSSKLNETRKAIEEKDMGHETPENAIEFLSDNASSFIYNLEDKGFTFDQQQVLWGYIWKSIDRILARNWHLVCDEIIERVSSMTEEEQEEWINNEGSEPLDPNKVWLRSASDLSESVSLESLTNKVREDLVARDSASFLTLSWGISNALCKYKKMAQ